MIALSLLFDASPIGNGVGLIGGLVFFVVLAVVAFIAFAMLRKTLKMAFRIVIVGVILLIAIAGSIAFFAFGSGFGKSGPVRDKPKVSQPK